MTGNEPPMLRSGVFLAPFHRPSQSTALGIETDLANVELLDRLGYDQIWFGEHHSTGYEFSPSPEIMIAAAAQRTSRIQLCSGVVSLPYHHPLMVADRMAFLDHLTRGRVIFGMGPGALPSDAQMMGIEYNSLRPRMDEALTAIMALLDGGEPVTMRTDWFELVRAQLQHGSFRVPAMKMAVASAISPAGPRLAGKHGIGLVSFGGTSDRALESLGSTWEVMSEQSVTHGTTISRDEWAIVGMLHIAESEADARREAEYGLREFFEFRHAASPYRLYDDDDIAHDDLVDLVNSTGTGVIGTPDMAVQFIDKLVDDTGGFGTFLINANDWANTDATRRAWELFAREVMPRLDGRSGARVRSFDSVMGRRDDLAREFLGGIQHATESYARERRSPPGS